MRFERFPFHPAPIGRTRRRIKNAERSIQKERDTLLHFFKRDDWLKEDIEAITAQFIPGGVVEKLGRHTVTLRKSGVAESGVVK
jgi:hypothetical protein